MELSIDILPFLKATFRKGKVTWGGMLQSQWASLRSAVIEVAGRRREPADFKDIVTLSSVSALLQYYLISNKSQALEAVRYLMVASEEVYCYQLEKIKEQIQGNLHQQSRNHSLPDTLLIFDVEKGQ